MELLVSLDRVKTLVHDLLAIEVSAEGWLKVVEGGWRWLVKTLVHDLLAIEVRGQGGWRGG